MYSGFDLYRVTYVLGGLESLSKTVYVAADSLESATEHIASKTRNSTITCVEFLCKNLDFIDQENDLNYTKDDLIEDLRKRNTELVEENRQLQRKTETDIIPSDEAEEVHFPRAMIDQSIQSNTLGDAHV